MCASDRLRWAIALLCSVALVPAFGQQPSREQEQLRRLRQQVQQLQQQQATQQDTAQRATADAAAALTQRNAAQAELRRLRAAAAAQTHSTEAAQKDLDAERAAHAALQAQVTQLQAALDTSRRSAEQLRAEAGEQQRQRTLRDTQLTDLTTRHATQAQGLQTCMANNQALRDIGAELLQRYADKGVADVLAQNEPFLQFRRVALENLLQGYQDKLDLQAVKTQPAAVPRAP